MRRAAAGASAEATRASPSRPIDRFTWSALISHLAALGLPSRRSAGPTSSRWPWARPARCDARVTAATSSSGEPSAAFALDHQRPEGEQRARGAAGLGPVLDEPAALAGDGGEACLGVDGDGEPDGLEQREVARRVGVGHGLLDAQPLAGAVVADDLGPRLAGGRDA